METKNKSRLKIPSMQHKQQKRLFKNANVNDLGDLHTEKRREKRVKRRKGRVKSNGKGFVVKEKIGSAESFLRENDLSRGHVSIVHNKCHSNDARGFYEEPAIVSLDLHEIDKNMEHLAFEPRRTAPAIGSIAVPF